MGSRAWVEVGEGMFYRRYDSVNVNVGLVVGDDGALLIDTRAAPSQAFETASHVRDITSLPIRWVVNTHHHWDHTFGNGAFFDAGIWGHPACREAMMTGDDFARSQAATWEPQLADELVGASVVPPDHLIDPVAEIDLGGRTATLEYLGRAHTAGDVVVRVTDAAAVFAGDMLESGGPPSFGDSYPVAWADTAGRIAGPRDSAFVPGHGPAMSTADMETQLAELRAVAALCRKVHIEGADPDSIDLADAPYPETTMREALRRGLRELGA